jgi:hypothetical protein
MATKRRDPRFTGKIKQPWSADSLCPCGSSRRAADCCQLPNGLFRKQFTYPTAPLPQTGYANACCYLRSTKNCSDKRSGEHFISASVLRIVNERHIKVKNLPWLAHGEIAELQISKLRSHILCKRHNEALSSLDQSAGAFFRAVRAMFDDIANSKTLSRKPQWFLASGEELELWLVKTAFGLYESECFAHKNGNSPERLPINPTILRAFQGARIPKPCGLYLMATGDEQWAKRDAIDVSPMFSQRDKRMVGMSLAFMGLTFLILLDPRIAYPDPSGTYTFRPSAVQFRNAKRSHTIVLTWGDQPLQRAVLYTASRRG